MSEKNAVEDVMEDMDTASEPKEVKVAGPKHGASNYAGIIPFPMELAEAVCNDKLVDVVGTLSVPEDVLAAAQAEVESYTTPDEQATMEMLRKNTINSEVSIRENFQKLQELLMAAGDAAIDASTTVKLDRAFTKILYYLARKNLAATGYQEFKKQFKASAPQPEVDPEGDF